MHSLRLNQVTLGAVDFAASVSFYERLGLKLIVHSPPRYARLEFPISEYEMDPATLSLHSVEADWAAPENWPLIYFEVDDVAGFLSDANCQPVSLPEIKSHLWEEADILDPSGNRIRIFKAGTARRFPPWRID